MLAAEKFRECPKEENSGLTHTDMCIHTLKQGPNIIFAFLNLNCSASPSQLSDTFKTGFEGAYLLVCKSGISRRGSGYFER